MAIEADFWALETEKNMIIKELESLKELIDNDEMGNDEQPILTNYAKYMKKMIVVEKELNQVITSLAGRDAITDEIRMVIKPKSLRAIYPKDIEQYYNRITNVERRDLLKKMGLTTGLIDIYLKPTFASLDEGVKEKLRGIHNG